METPLTPPSPIQGAVPPAPTQSPPTVIEGGVPPITPPLPGLTFADETLRTHQGLSKFKDADSLGKSYIELEKKLGERPGVKPLTAESTPEEVTAYRQALGVPEKPDGYEVGELTYPEAATPSTEQLGKWKAIFHEAHLTPAQAQAILKAHSLDISEQWNAMEAQRVAQGREDRAALTKLWGGHVQQYEAMAKKTIQAFFGPEGLQEVTTNPDNPAAPFASPTVVTMAVKLAQYTGHDKFIMADSAGGIMDQGTARAKVAELYGRLSQARRDGKDEEADTINREIQKYQPIAG